MSDVITIPRWRERLARMTLVVAMTLSVLFIVSSVFAVVTMYEVTRPSAGAAGYEADYAMAIIISPVTLSILLPLALTAAAWFLDSSALRWPLGRFSMGAALMLYILIIGLLVACRVLKIDVGYNW
ncbi:MAG TPA: hypothetical protein VHY09_01050 [Candidatus Methylacidiphilales bacterium]|jgi:hypothetical protein|nr:hypothetical protein [Candidatus Methylacidiphilales bacterium]